MFYRYCGRAAHLAPIHGKDIPMHAEILNIDALSADADKDELFRWAAGFQDPHTRIFVVQGEPKSSKVLQHRLKEKLGWQAQIPNENETIPH